MEDWTDDRLELALRASNEGIWDWDLGSDEITYSGRILRFLNYRRHEVPHLFRTPDLIHPDDREEFEGILAQTMRPDGGELIAAEPRFKDKKGNYKWFRIRGVVQRDEQGTVKRMVGSMIDISRRKRIEERLKEERHLMRLLIDNVPLHIYFKDLDSNFTLVNQSMAEWLGTLGPDEVAGKSDRDFFDEEHWKQALADEQKVIETGEGMLDSVERETWAGREDTWVLTSKMPLLDRKGRLQGTFGVSSDVTELVNTQRALAEVASKLQARNEEIEEELMLAREVQQALLPTTYPILPEGVPEEESVVQFGQRYIPISGLAGDFFEVYPLGENQVGMLICDVMGHGVRSAIIVSMLRGLAERALESGSDPARFLADLNAGLQGILSKADVTMFATAFCAVIDLDAAEIRYASAGHPAGIYRGPGGTAPLPLGGRGPGPGLGLFPDSEYESQSLSLAQVHCLLLFTDGILEVENKQGEAFLQNRLVKLVDECQADKIEDCLDGILGGVLSFAEHKRFDDDVCLLAAQIGR